MPETTDFYETTVLEITSPTEEDYHALLADECTHCGADISHGAPVFVWGEPLDQEDPDNKANPLALTVSCSRECVQERIDLFADYIQRDVMVLWRVR